MRGGRKQTDALVVLNKDLTKLGLNITESVVRPKPRKTISITIHNTSKEDVILGKNVPIGHLEEGIEVLSVEQAVDDIMQKIGDSPKINMVQNNCMEELYERLEQVKPIAR